MQLDGLDNSYHVNIIINLLVRFPEIYTITYNTASSGYCLSYMVNGKIKKDDFLQLRRQLLENLEAYSFFKKKEMAKLTFKMKTFFGFTRLEVNLQGESPISEEIGLINSLFKDIFCNLLVSELRTEDVEGAEDQGTPWEDMLTFMHNRKSGDAHSNLFAFRDAGKVYVFDK